MLRHVLFTTACFCLAAYHALAAPLELHVDADFSKSTSSSQSIELGIRTALAEIDYRIGDQEIVVVPKDHRGNVKRSFNHMKQMAASDTALALFGGMISPPYLKHKDYINDNRLLTLLTWSAAAPITRARTDAENWIFRLSVDDLQSAPFFVNTALDTNGCTSIALLLMDTGWGRANQHTLTAALKQRGVDPAVVTFFPSAIGAAAAGTLASNLAQINPDCAVFLSGWAPASILVPALHKYLPTLKLFSHWGIMGGSFTEQVPHDVRIGLRISVLQTCGLRRETEGNAVLTNALHRAMPNAAGLSDVAAPTGFVHGYDMTRILIAATRQAMTTPEWQGPITQKRRAVRAALEALEHPVEGILKRYQTPFAPYSSTAPDAHEALGLADLCLAQFGADGRLEDAQ